MKKIFCIIIFTIFSTNIFARMSLPDDVISGLSFFQEATLREQIEFLTSNALQGRLSLQPGDEKATQWIASQFAIARLTPLNNGSYLQPVNLIEFKSDINKTYLTIQTASSLKHWQQPSIFLNYPNNLHLTNSVIFAGFGITAPELGYDDYANTDVHGKIVLVFEHEPQETNPHSIFNGLGNTVYATNRVKALNAQRHGAIAILIAPEPNRQHPSNQERRQRIADKAKRNASLPEQALAEDELHIPIVIISDQVADSIVNSKQLSQWQKQIDDSLHPISQTIANLTATIHNENAYVHQGTSYNIAGLLEGSDPSLKNETIIVSAHHDHNGMQHKQIWHGADDNASGTIGVINIARAYSLAAQHPKRSILFVIFAAEERGLLGSTYMANHPLRPLATTRAMINFDMIGRNEAASPQTDHLIAIPNQTSNRLNLIGSHYSSDYEKTVEQQNQYTGLTLDHRFDDENALNVFFRSDQFPFILKNVPAFWWFTGFHPDYHQITDTADKINYVKMKKILQLAYLTIYQFANEKVPPHFINTPKPG